MRYNWHFTRAFSIITVALTAWSATGQTAPGDWPQWRGPNRDGISPETGLLKSWPDQGPPLAWRTTGLGTGYSGLSVVGDQLFTMGDQGESNYLLALDRNGGEPLWTVKVGKAGAPGWGGFKGPRCTPTVDEGLAFAIGQYGEIICVRLSDHQEVWRKHLIDDFQGSLPEWGYSESPLVDGDKVLFTPGGSQGTVVALNKQTGDLLWQTKEWTDNAHYSSIIVEEIGDVRQYIQLTDAHVAGLGEDGGVLWKAPRKGRTAVVPTPIYAENRVYVTSGYGVGCNLIRILTGSTFGTEEVYDNKVMVNHHGGVLKLDAHVYGHSDTKGWVCQDFETGELVWAEKSELKKGSLTCADGLLICREEDQGTIALLKATPAGYSEMGRFEQPDRTKQKAWTHPVVAGGKLYIRDQDLLFCYDVSEK